jgi:carboxymethylenebutenolidase
MKMAAQQENTRDVTYPGKACSLKAFVAEPSHGGHQHAAVIVVQEWWGLDGHIKDVARRLAAEDYVTIAPDLYSRHGNQVTQDPNVAGELMAGLKQSDGLDDLLSTIDWLKTQAGVRADRIGVMGFCMGGSYAMALPCLSSEIKAAAPFYGEIPPDDMLQKLHCPVFYAYGENDGWIQRKDVARLAGALKKFNKSGEVKTYAGCSHGFFNDTRPDVYSAKDARDAWDRTLKLFEQTLKKKP